MHQPIWISAVVAVTCLGAAFIVTHRHRKGKRIPYPPGPPPRWFTGNLRDIPESYPWLRFSEWHKTYGEIVYATILGKPFIVLNSLEACKELMGSASGRPFSAMYDLMGMSNDMTNGQETPMWRYQRRLTSTAFGPQAVKGYYSLQQMYAARFIKKMLECPEADCETEVRDAMGKSIFAVSYGLPIEEHYETFIHLNEIVSKAFLAAMVPGRYLVESIPVLRYVPKWFPGAGFRRHAALICDTMEQHSSMFFNAVKREIAAGSAPPSLVANCLQAQESGEISSSLPSRADEEAALKWVAGEMYRAGTHTTVQTLIKIITALQLYPEVQRKAQEEIARVVGPDRLPEVGDRDSLPYVNAIITEAHRWHPAVALGVPHRTTKDEVYKGYLIPKDSTLVGNEWILSQIADDGSPLDRPGEFIPERFLPGTAERAPDSRDYVFGFGRRVCPGRHLAENLLFLTTSNILATTRVSNPVDADGKHSPPAVKWTGENAISFPVPFRPLFQSRSPVAVELIENAAAPEAAFKVDNH
ncbi:cytochrome P450 [Auricularia subglabra TFB-10046 SS5]|nr:cytochrome P450 [Auricularia subglabra TFB-10046 SS5]